MRRLTRSGAIVRLSLGLVAVLQVWALLVALERPAQAYVDPGSGYVLLQVMGSMAVGALYYLRHHLRKLLWMIRGKEEPMVSLDSEAIPKEGSEQAPPKADL